MGYHYTPQKHLQRFEISEREGHIWQYDRKSDQFKALPISKVAQEKNFYPDDVEKDLNFLLEIPGNACITQLLNREQLTAGERWKLSNHIVAMCTRGPRHRDKRAELSQQVLPNVIQKLRHTLLELAKEEGHDSAQALISQVDQLKDRWSDNLPPFVDEMIRTPFLSERTVKAIFEMTWEIVPTAPGYEYITSDTPACFFEWLGIGREDSEVTFPISKTVALVGHNRGLGRCTRFRESSIPRETKELNRRIINSSKRFLYSSKDFFWIPLLGQKKQLELTNIRW